MKKIFTYTTTLILTLIIGFSPITSLQYKNYSNYDTSMLLGASPVKDIETY